MATVDIRGSTSNASPEGSCEMTFDLHRKKAAEIFGIPESEVTPEQRRYGKVANYSEIYSMPGKLSGIVGPTTGRTSSAQLANLPTASAEAHRVRCDYTKEL